MKAYTYVDRGRFELCDKPKPTLPDPRDALVRVTLGSICTSDLHIKHGNVPRAVRGITVGHETVGIVEAVGEAVSAVAPGDRVAVNVETFCGECFFCRHGYVNNCTDPDGGWALGCRIDGGQAEYVRVPHADQGLTRIPDGVSDEQALFVGDILATGFWAARITEIDRTAQGYEAELIINRMEADMHFDAGLQWLFTEFEDMTYASLPEAVVTAFTSEGYTFNAYEDDVDRIEYPEGNATGEYYRIELDREPRDIVLLYNPDGSKRN